MVRKLIGCPLFQNRSAKDMTLQLPPAILTKAIQKYKPYNRHAEFSPEVRKTA